MVSRAGTAPGQHLSPGAPTFAMLRPTRAVTGVSDVVGTPTGVHGEPPVARHTLGGERGSPIGESELEDSAVDDERVRPVANEPITCRDRPFGATDLVGTVFVEVRCSDEADRHRLAGARIDVKSYKDRSP